MSRARACKKPRNRASFAGPLPENVLLPECRMTAAACSRFATTNERGSQTGPLTAVPRIVRGSVQGRTRQTSFQERYT
jgi:hypothetical protein